MRVLLSGMAAAVAVAIIAAAVLWSAQAPVYENYASTSTRVGTPGTNLVGERWSGNPSLTQVPRDGR